MLAGQRKHEAGSTVLYQLSVLYVYCHRHRLLAIATLDVWSWISPVCVCPLDRALHGMA